MTQERNNEIDLLLRRLSRGQGVSGPDGDLRVETDHLDADELSSYAENALPAAARTRYTEHLAECSRCRELVVQLSSAAGVVIAEESSRVAGPSGLRKFLASLFSPMVLRYAVPAMGLIVVALIGFAVFRNDQPGNTDIAALQETPTPVVQQPAPLSGLRAEQDKSDSPSAIPEDRAAKAKAVEAPAPVGTPAASGAVVGANKAPTADTASQPVVTAAEPPPPAPKPTQTVEEFRTQADARRQEAEGRTATANEAQKEKAASDQITTDGKREVARARPATGRGADASAPTAGAGARTLQLGEAKKDDDAEARTVAGRRFRKRGDIWVDTAYAGGAIVNYSRGSESYRGLVADEPEIKKIAEQLDGPFIVVWKGTAYRIR